MLNQNNVKEARKRIAKKKNRTLIRVVVQLIGIISGVFSVLIGLSAFAAYISAEGIRSSNFWALSMICIILGFYLAQYCYKSLRNL